MMQPSTDENLTNYLQEKSEKADLQLPIVQGECALETPAVIYQTLCLALSFLRVLHPILRVSILQAH